MVFLMFLAVVCGDVDTKIDKIEHTVKIIDAKLDSVLINYEKMEIK